MNAFLGCGWSEQTQAQLVQSNSPSTPPTVSEWDHKSPSSVYDSSNTSIIQNNSESTNNRTRKQLSIEENIAIFQPSKNLKGYSSYQNDTPLFSPSSLQSTSTTATPEIQQHHTPKGVVSHAAAAFASSAMSSPSTRQTSRSLSPERNHNQGSKAAHSAPKEEHTYIDSASTLSRSALAAHIDIAATLSGEKMRIQKGALESYYPIVIKLQAAENIKTSQSLISPLISQDVYVIVNSFSREPRKPGKPGDISKGNETNDGTNNTFATCVGSRRSKSVPSCTNVFWEDEDVVLCW